MSLAKANYKSYRKVCPSSYADPTLFANRCQRRKGVGHLLNKNNSSNNNDNNIGASSIDDFKHETIEKKGAGIFLESVRVTDPIPACTRPYLCTYRTPGPLILNCKEMERICKEQKYKGVEELEEEEKTCLENKLEKIEELEQCRGLWQDLRMQQDCMADDSRCEELRKYHARHELFPYGRLNNEAEMRLLDKMSKAAENRNIWKEQMKERQEILQQWKEEDWRLDAETEKLRLAAVGSEEELKARKKKELMIGLVNQINCKKLEKIEEAEIKHLEGEAMRKCWEKLNEEEFDRITGGSGNRMCYKDQLDICMLQKIKKKIEDDAAERAVLERINRIRKELDEKIDTAKENRRQHIEMQQKIADLLRCRLEVVLDKQTEAEVKRIQRSMEQADKDFMRRELEDESKRKEIEYLVKKGRDCQLQTKRELQAIEATRDKLYFESDLRRLIKDIEFERGAEGRKQKRKEYGNVLKQQMCDNEQLRKEFMSEKYKYGRELAEKECMRRKLIEGEMDKKFSCLREKGVPEQVIKKITGKITEEFKGEKFAK